MEQNYWCKRCNGTIYTSEEPTECRFCGGMEFSTSYSFMAAARKWFKAVGIVMRIILSAVLGLIGC